MLCQRGFCTCCAVRRGAEAGRALDAVSRLRKGGGEFGLPTGGQCHGFRAGLQGAALRSGQKIAQPAEDCRNGQAVGGTGGPVVPLAAPAHKALHGDHGTFPGRLRQAGAGGACRAAQLPQNDLSTARVQGVIPDAGGKVRTVQQVFGPGGELPCHLAGCVVAELPALAEQLEVQVAAAHGGVKHLGAAIGRLPQLQIGISAAQVLYLDGQEQGRIVFLCGHGTVHLFKIAAGIHSGSPLWFWMMCRKPSIGCSLPAL